MTPYHLSDSVRVNRFVLLGGSDDCRFYGTYNPMLSKVSGGLRRRAELTDRLVPYDLYIFP